MTGQVLAVLVVEDEVSARRQIGSYLAGMPGIRIAGEARDGEEAVRETARLHPDIILLDIRMPRLDGLAAARLIRQQDPDAVIVFLTAYPEFEYARQAVRLGASDYVLKPIKREELRLAVEHAAEKCAARRSAAGSGGIAPVEAPLEPLVRKEFLNILVTWPHLLRGEEAAAQARALGLRGGVPRVVLVARPPGGSPDGWSTDHLRWHSGDMLVGKSPSLITAAAAPWPAPPTWPEEWVGSASRHLGNECGCAVFAGDYCEEVGDLPRSYRTAVARLAGHGSTGGRDVVEREMRICEQVLRGDLAGATRAVAELLAEMDPVQRAEEVRMLAGLLAVTFVRAGLDPAVAAESRLRFLGMAAGLAAQGAAEAVGEFARELRERFAETQSAGEQAVALARAYVEENCHRDLTLRQVAAHVYLSPYYFARLFKAHTGMTLGEYVTDFRMRKACDLLRSTSLPVTAVAKRVGYCSPSYFSALFSKTFGMSPGQYREAFGEAGRE